MSDPSPPSAPTPGPSSGSGRQPPPGQRPYGQFGSDPQPPRPLAGALPALQSRHEQSASSPPQYPRQQLLPQEVQPGRSRLPLFIGLVVMLALVGGGVAAWLLLRDEGEDTRADYCAALKELTNDGDLMGVVASADESTLVQLEEVAELAPGAIDTDWQRLRDLAETGDFTASTAFAAYAALQSIVQDAENECGMDIPLPGF